MPRKDEPYQAHPEVSEDLKEIWSYIANDNPTAAERVRDRILDRFQFAANNPGLGQTRETLTNRPLRFVSVYNYLIAYAPGRSPVSILAVLHGARDPQVLQTILQGRSEDWQNDPH